MSHIWHVFTHVCFKVSTNDVTMQSKQWVVCSPTVAGAGHETSRRSGRPLQGYFALFQMADCETWLGEFFSSLWRPVATPNYWAYRQRAAYQAQVVQGGIEASLHPATAAVVSSSAQVWWARSMAWVQFHKARSQKSAILLISTESNSPQMPPCDSWLHYYNTFILNTSKKGFRGRRGLAREELAWPRYFLCPLVTWGALSSSQGTVLGEHSLLLQVMKHTLWVAGFQVN